MKQVTLMSKKQFPGVYRFVKSYLEIFGSKTFLSMHVLRIPTPYPVC